MIPVSASRNRVIYELLQHGWANREGYTAPSWPIPAVPISMQQGTVKELSAAREQERQDHGNCSGRTPTSGPLGARGDQASLSSGFG